SSLLKVAEGGWFPLALGGFVFIIMTTWRRGRVLATAAQKRLAIPLSAFIGSLAATPPHRVPGTAVFMAGDPDSVPNSLMHNLKHNKVLHERVVFLTVIIRDVPWVPAAERVAIGPLGYGFFRLKVYFGFMDRPDVAASLELCRDKGLEFDLMQTTFFLSRAIVVPATGEQGRKGMAEWRESMFATMARNARTAADYYNIPPNCVIELGTKIAI